MDDVVSVSLHASTYFVPNNSVPITGSYLSSASEVETDITNEIPQTGSNGWYNFTYPIVEGINILNFSWDSEVVLFELITDKTAPVIGMFGMENDSNLIETAEITFWFRDDGAGIDRFLVELTLDGNKIGFNGPKENYTGTGYYIEKALTPENYDTGSHILKLVVYDLAANSVSISFIFNTYMTTETTKKGSGFQWDFMLLALLVGFIVLKKSKKLRYKK